MRHTINRLLNTTGKRDVLAVVIHSIINLKFISFMHQSIFIQTLDHLIDRSLVRSAINKDIGRNEPVLRNDISSTIVR